MKLANDICRCHDYDCSWSSNCERFLQKDSGRVHCGSLSGAPECPMTQREEED